MGSAHEYDFIFRDSLLYCTQGGNKVSLVILEDTGLQTDLLKKYVISNNLDINGISAHIA